MPSWLNRKRLAVIGTGISFILLTILYFSFAPDIAVRRSLTVLKNMGIDTSLFPAAEHKMGLVTYSNVNLDKDSISTIKSLKMSYTPFGLLILGRFKIIDIDGLSLIGEGDLWGILNGQDKSFSLTGWQPANMEALYESFPTSLLVLKNTQISLLTEQYGGVSLNFDIQARRKGAGAEFQSTFKTAQRYLSLSGKGNGTLGKNLLFAELEIDQGKIEFPDNDTRATRINGWINIAKPVDDDVKLSGELRAGGVRLLGTPWQNASSTIEFYQGSSKILAEAKSVGIEGLELSLTHEQLGSETGTLSGSLHTESMAALMDYLEAIKKLPASRKELKILEALPGAVIDFDFGSSLFEENKVIDFSARLDESDVIVHGKSIVKPDMTFAGKFKSDPIILSAESTDGAASLEGSFSQDNKKKFAMDLKANVKDYKFHTIEKISGPMEFDSSLQELTMKKPSTCSFVLSDRAKSKVCKVALAFGTRGLRITALSADFTNDGRITFKEKDNTAAIKFDQFDLSVLPDKNDKRVELSGIISGTLPLKYKDGHYVVAGGKLKTHGGGNIKAVAGTLDSYVRDPEMQTPVAAALKNYPFESLELNVNGPLDGNIKLNILMRTDKKKQAEQNLQLPSVLNFDADVTSADMLSRP